MMFREVVLGIATLAYMSIFSDTPMDPEGYVKDRKNILDEYDFIVIGAGSAGAVIANRLTEIPEWKVLLLEAGGDESFFSQVPGVAANIQLTKKDWQYKTTPQENGCLVSPDKRCLWPRGKMLGGSSSLNYMLYVRGNKRDYDGWAALGNTGWSYNELLPYFKKSEDNQNPYLAGTKYHGKGGYLTVDEVGYKTPLGAAFIQGGVEMGYQNRDCNGEFQTGFMFAQGTVRRGTRCSTSKAFLRPVRNRPNLHISMNSRVLKIVIDSTTKEATGVRFEKNGKIYNVRARKEVVVSTGDLATPQLLMLSGIGPSAHLQEKGINPILADLPVGDNLHDHVAVGGLVFTVAEPYSLLALRYVSLPVMLNYTLYGGTPLSLFGGIEALAWVKTKYADANDDYPDVQLHFGPASDVSDYGFAVKLAHGIPDDVWDKYYKPLMGTDTCTILVNALRPKSRGTIRLNSADPYDPPLINPNYYQDPYDVQVTIEGVKIALALTKTEAFKKLGVKFYDKPFPGCENIKLWTDEYWTCYIKRYCLTLAHTAGTCKMGPDGDATSVVDSKLRVRGIKKLRIGDTSIMPLVPSGNTNAAAIMIGEKVSDLIKDTWSN